MQHESGSYDVDKKDLLALLSQICSVDMAKWQGMPYIDKERSIRNVITECDKFDDHCDLRLAGMLFYIICEMEDEILRSPQLTYDILRCLAFLCLHFAGNLRISVFIRVWSHFKTELLENFNDNGSIRNVELRYMDMVSLALDVAPKVIEE